MDQGSLSRLLSVGRKLVFGISTIVAVGWLIAPDFVASGRTHVADFAHVRSEQVSLTASAGEDGESAKRLPQIALRPSEVEALPR